MQGAEHSTTPAKQELKLVNLPKCSNEYIYINQCYKQTCMCRLRPALSSCHTSCSEVGPCYAPSPSGWGHGLLLWPAAGEPRSLREREREERTRHDVSRSLIKRSERLTESAKRLSSGLAARCREAGQGETVSTGSSPLPLPPAPTLLFLLLQSQLRQILG